MEKPECDPTLWSSKWLERETACHYINWSICLGMLIAPSRAIHPDFTFVSGPMQWSRKMPFMFRPVEAVNIRNMLLGYGLDYFISHHRMKFLTLLGSTLIFLAVLTMLFAASTSMSRRSSEYKASSTKVEHARSQERRCVVETRILWGIIILDHPWPIQLYNYHRLFVDRCWFDVVRPFFKARQLPGDTGLEIKDVESVSWFY